MNAPEPIDIPSATRAGTTYHPVPTPQSGAHGHHLVDDVQRLARQRRSRRATFIKWLRKVHGWVGLWGAVLGLLFGVTGFLLNHRAGPLKVSSGEPQVEQLQIPLPARKLESPLDMAHWLQGELHLDGKPSKPRREPSHPVAWGDRSAVQPEFWQVGIFGTRQNVQAEYWVGNGYVSVKRTQNSFLTTMNNLHRGVGLSIGWVLLVDTLAGGMILLSLTGVLLWTELNKRRTVGVVLVLGSLIAAVALGLL
ncbi:MULTISPECIES: PepSY-associated TM helix domain-containing protein [Paraburkholderia]|uniref:PepSY-associated TM helix domain-containing protein n=1 Tax=Paraburkholderia sp. CHISQ3 TaxID=2937435 RepID=UPI00225A3B97|nr:MULTISPECIES: PepSY-associated TM helix domain-containing protein [Paraburkholderia]MCX4163784.1 PepSY-associated TM helix domain-containing protein [Paraburkholderia megapolitana]MDN7159279.1 PepSY-associated TM helix domain-containing protein [Paraburkholderia sp. CHISQ3]MDQ6496326.1 PepSY-associated TM helix domain-containing protein [Paraburkholderia megapolitana]